MQSFKSYSDKKFTYYNSIQSVLENSVPSSYEELISKHGAAIDSVLYKMNLYNKRSINSHYINEAYQDVLFTLDEQFATRDILITVTNQYIESLYNDFCIENEIQIDESAKDFLNKIGDAVKKGSDKVTQGFKSLGEKVAALKEFIKDVMNKAIKSAKELVNRITELMLKIGSSLQELVKKLGGNDEEQFEVFKGLVENATKDEKTSKENVYETLSNKLNNDEEITEDYIFELFGLGKKKDKEEVKDKSTNEYDDAAKAKEGGKSSGKLKPLLDAGLKIFLQMMAYYAVTVFLPAVVTLFGGPLAGAVVEVIAKLAWSSATIYKQFTDMVKTYKSEEYKKMPTWAKVLRWTMFLISCYFAAKAGTKAFKDGLGIVKALTNSETITKILPSDIVQKVTEKLNNFWKLCTGENAVGYEKMVAAQNATMTEIIELAGDGKEASDEGKEKFDMKKNTEFNKNETNNFDHYDELGQKELSAELKGVANAGEKSSQAVLDNVDKISVSTPGTTAFAVDGATLGKIGRENFIKQIADKLNVSPTDIDISQVSDIALRDSTKGMAGTFFTVIVKGDATSEFTDLAQQAVQDVAKNAGMGGGYFHMLSKIADNVNPAKIQEVPVNIFKNTFAAFAGLMPIASKWTKKGGFRLRLGSGRTGNHLYDIEEVKEMSFSDAFSKYESKNPTVFKKMAKIVNDNNKLLEDYKKQLDELKKMDKEQKKKHKLITQQLEKMKDGSKDYKLLIFLTKDEFANKEVTGKKKEEKSEVKEAQENNLYPVAFFNPMLLAGGDLAPCSSSKKPRANIYFAKGLFSRWEMLPKDGGMSKEDIVNMFTELMKESLKACYNMAPDVPCKKEDDKYVENEESQFKGKERKDFGGFTNTQLTEIFNSPDEVTKYLGGKYATDTFNGGLKHDYSERDDVDYLKTHHDKVIKEYGKIINDDEELKDFIKNSDTLKYLLDDNGNLKEDELEKISDNLIRVEQNYLKGEKKKGLFDKVKKWLKKDEDEGKEASKDIDPTELRDFAFKLASKWKKYRRKMNKLGKDEEVKESLEDDYDIDFTIFDANLEIFENEFPTYFTLGKLLVEDNSSIGPLILE